MEGILFQVLEYVGHAAYLSLAQSHRASQHQQSGPAAYRGLPCPPAGTVITKHTPQLACIIIQYFIPVAGASYLAQFALHWGRNQQVITACSFPMHACVLFTFLGHQQVWSYYIVSFIILHTHTHTLYESLFLKINSSPTDFVILKRKGNNR